jgi:hypothetical protein
VWGGGGRQKSSLAEGELKVKFGDGMHHDGDLNSMFSIRLEGFWLGMAAVVVASCISGFAGVFIEKILKKGGSAATSLWMRNIQLVRHPSWFL